MRYQLILITGLLSMGGLFAGCGGNQQKPPAGPPPPVNVTVEEVILSPAVYYDEYPGTVVAVNQTELRAQVTGYITGIYFKDGDKVKKGQRLYSIDAQLYSANLQQAQANLAVQETNLVKAQKDADRYHELDKKDAIAKQQVDYADAALDAAKKQVDAAKANVRSVGTNVNFSTIIAPFTGTIGISQVRSGTSVIAGQTILNTISTDDPMAVDFAISQDEVYRFTQLQAKKSAAKDSTFTIAFGTDVYPKSGSLSFVDRAVDPQTGTLRTRLVFPNTDHLLRAGMNTTVRVLNNSGKPSVVVPYKAVSELLGEYFVYVVGDSNKVSQKRITPGRQLGANIIVKEGLNGGEKIVIQGIQNLREGAVVNISQPGAPKPQQ